LKAWPGFVKIKMLHRAGGTILLPEIVVIGGAGNQWVQPQFVHAPLFSFADDGLGVKISLGALDHSRHHRGGLECELTFRRSDRCAALADRSEVYRCHVETAHSPAQLSVGRARVRADGGIDVCLYHHTAEETLRLIHESRHVRGSPWNYQGTRELTNVSYAYFTSIRSVSTEADLQSIAMASRGKIGLRLDTNRSSDPDLLLDVYRESTSDRRATLKLWVPGETISTPHIWQHAGLAVHYEVTRPWIYRVGLRPRAHLDFLDGCATPDPASLKRFDYAVIGDCNTTIGLEAPFDEENTSETFVVEDLTGTNLFDFWRDHANAQLHTSPSITPTFRR
jgi:hypothetical protein